ncbi:hypothetical protein GCM10027271_21580 [Saccharopolyspora gloriosae]
MRTGSGSTPPPTTTATHEPHTSRPSLGNGTSRIRRIRPLIGCPHAPTITDPAASRATTCQVPHHSEVIQARR